MIQKNKKMDTKVIAMVGAVIVVGAAVYGVATGTVLPGTENIEDGGGDGTSTNTGDANTDTSNNEGTQNEEDSSDDNDVGDEEANITSTENGNVTDDGSATETSNEEEEGSEEDTETGENPVYVCEERSSEFDIVNRHSAAGPPFDPFLFESMLHDEINELREIRTDAEPLECDPELREAARGLSDPTVAESESVQLGEVCENPRTRTGAWYYQRDMELNPPDGSSNQRVPFIANHEDLVLDVRGAWGGSGGFVDDVTDTKMTRQGVGAYIERDTRRVVVTQVLCGEEITEMSETG